MRMGSGAPAHCEESALSQLPSIEHLGKKALVCQQASGLLPVASAGWWRLPAASEHQLDTKTFVDLLI